MAQVDAADEQLVLEGQAQLRRARRIFQQQQAALAVADHVQVGQPAGGILAVERNRLQAVVAVADAEVEPERIEVHYRAIRQHRLRPLRRLGRLRPELHPNAEQILAARTGRVPHQATHPPTHPPPAPAHRTPRTAQLPPQLLRRRVRCRVRCRSPDQLHHLALTASFALRAYHNPASMRPCCGGSGGRRRRAWRGLALRCA